MQEICNYVWQYTLTHMAFLYSLQIVDEKMLISFHWKMSNLFDVQLLYNCCEMVGRDVNYAPVLCRDV